MVVRRLNEQAARMRIPTSEFIILSHTVLIATAELIPLPFLDDTVALVLWRRMVSLLARTHGRQLTNTQIGQLVGPTGIIGSGCLSILLYPLKKIFREIFFWLEWQAAIDTAAQAYYSGYLLSHVLAQDTFEPARAAQYAAAVQCAKKGMNTRLIKGVLSRSLKTGTGVARSLTRWLYNLGVHHTRQFIGTAMRLVLARRRRPVQSQAPQPSAENSGADQVFEPSQPGIRDLLDQLVGSVRDGIGALPHDHLEALRRRLDESCGAEAHAALPMTPA